MTEIKMSLQRFIRSRIEMARQDYINAAQSDNERSEIIAMVRFKELREVALQLDMDIETVGDFLKSR